MCLEFWYYNPLLRAQFTRNLIVNTNNIEERIVPFINSFALQPGHMGTTEIIQQIVNYIIHRGRSDKEHIRHEKAVVPRRFGHLDQTHNSGVSMCDSVIIDK